MTPTYRSSFSRSVLGVILFSFVILWSAHVRATDLSGTWSGTWNSDRCRHHGPMTAYLCKLDNGNYAATFRGRFFRIMPFRYTTVLNVDADGDVVQLSGSSYLGRLFGTFTFQANATATNFNATYSSCKDWGRFCLTRCSTCSK